MTTMPKLFLLSGGLALALAGASLKVQAQSIIASGDLTGTAAGPDYDYSLTVSDSGAATSPIGSFWFGWVPGEFFLATDPTSASAPTGWSATVVNNSIQFLASSSTYDIAPGGSLSGFGFTSADTPATMAGDAVAAGYPTTPVTTTVAYGAGFFSSPSDTFVVTVVPEPSSLALLLAGPLYWFAIRRRIRK